MSATLSPRVGNEFVNASDREKFFNEQSAQNVNRFEQREVVAVGDPSGSCTTNLFFGFFFDGTKNNYIQAERGKDHSNVARLYDCYPGLSVPGVLPRSAEWEHKPMPTNFFKVYVPGVASPFDLVGDTGIGKDQTFGAAFGALAERRIIWALLQAINNVHRFLLKTPLISPGEAMGVVRRVFLEKTARSLMVGDGMPRNEEEANSVGARRAFEAILRRSHRAVSAHWPSEKTGKPNKKDPGIVKTIYISIFGFSRGATEARAFVNWLQSLCKLDAQLGGRGASMSLGGFPVVFDFVGLFDTVASVGAGNTVGVFNGHGGWADAEDSLRIPASVKCLHLVAAHELRRSFPVDSISIKGVMPAGCQEVVVPGVHSDIGCGYCPREQGKGVDPDGADMLSRIPLIMMYKEARLSGVPLKLELASAVAKSRFALKAETIKAFNAYIGECKVTEGPIRSIMREHARKQIEWRLSRRTSCSTPLDKIASFKRASKFEQNELYSAGLEFEDEIKAFLEWMKAKGTGYKPVPQKAGFDNEYANEWQEIATWWNPAPKPSAAVVDLFDNYIHDSRAAFKLTGPDNEVLMRAMLDKWVLMRKNAQAPRHAWSGRDERPRADGLTDEQRQLADEYARTKQIPTMRTSGREPFSLGNAGYLRFRKIYGGHDNALLSANPSDDRISATG